MNIYKHNKIKVIFKNKKLTFVTYYTGKLEYLRDSMNFSGNYTVSFIKAKKEKDLIMFSLLDAKDTSLDLITIVYNFDFFPHYDEDNISDKITLTMFKRLTENYKFEVVDVYLNDKELK